MALLSGIQTALSGMKVAQNQLEIIGRNVANVDTEGYTRKTAQQNNLVLGGYNAGVKLGDVKRTVNQGLLRSFLSSNSLTTNLSAKRISFKNRDLTRHTAGRQFSGGKRFGFAEIF